MGHSDRHVTLPNGQSVVGASLVDARFQNFIGEYFRPDVDIHRGMTVVDVGANVGMFSLEILRRCDGDARVIAFEPAPETFVYLECNLHELFPDSQVQLHQCALGDHDGEVTLYHRPHTATTSSVYPEPLFHPVGYLDGFLREPPPEYRTPISTLVRRLPRQPVKRALTLAGRRAAKDTVQMQCRLTRLSTVLREADVERVDFLKIDVEGAEMDVLRGISAADWSKIRQLAVEVHDIDGRAQAVQGLLRDAGFGEIALNQDWPFEGTNVHMLHASRLDVR